MSLIGRHFRREDEPNSIGKVVKEVKDNTVIFSDNGRVDIGILNEKFIEIPPQANNTPPVSTVSPAQQHHNTHQPSDEVDPSSFLNNTGYASSIQQNGSVSIGDGGKVTKTIESAPQESGDTSGISPETMAQHQEIVKRQQELEKQKAEQAKNDPFMKQFSNYNEVYGNQGTQTEQQPQEEIRRLDSKTMPYHTPYNQGQVNQGNVNQGNVNQGQSQQQYPQQPVVQQSKLPKMKKVKKVDIKITFTEMIPKLEDIRSVESLFDDVSIIEEIAKEIVNKYISDRDSLEGMVIAELERLTKKPTRKTTRKKTTAKKTVSSEEDKPKRKYTKRTTKNTEE